MYGLTGSTFILGGFIWELRWSNTANKYNDSCRTWRTESVTGDSLFLYETVDYKGFISGHGWYVQLAEKESYDIMVESLEYPVSEMYNLRPDKLELGPGYLESNSNHNIVDLFSSYSRVNAPEIRIRADLANLIRIMRNPELDFLFADVLVLFSKITQRCNIQDLAKHGLNSTVDLLDNPFYQ